MNMNGMKKSVWLAALALSSVASTASATTTVYKCTINGTGNDSGTGTGAARPLVSPDNVKISFPDSNPLSTPCSSATPITIGCWTGSTDNFNAPDSITWAQAQLRTCDNKKWLRVYAFGTLASYFPPGSSFGSVKAEVDVWGSVGGGSTQKLVFFQDTSADGSWTAWTAIDSRYYTDPSYHISDVAVWGSYSYTP